MILEFSLILAIFILAYYHDLSGHSGYLYSRLILTGHFTLKFRLDSSIHESTIVEHFMCFSFFFRGGGSGKGPRGVLVRPREDFLKGPYKALKGVISALRAL